MFVVNKDNKALVAKRLKAEGSSWDEKLQYQPQYLWRLVRRTILPPEELYPFLAAVFKTYGPLEDAATGRPVFDKNAWKSAKTF